MTRKITILLFLLLTQLNLAEAAFNIPKPIGYVSDFANIIADEEEARLNKMLKQFNDLTTHQIAVATFSSLEGETMETLTLKIANQWGVGHKVYNNGVMIFIFFNDKKVRIEVGCGVDHILTNEESRRILYQVMFPHFKANNWTQGIKEAVEVIVKALSAFDVTKAEATVFACE